MSWGRINNGGGGGKCVAFINVTYPEGATCTCSKGTKVLKAKGTSGTFLFKLPEIGTWTVTITNDTRTVSKEVEITAEGQSKDVVMSFWNGKLYDAGNQYTDITGGWEKVGATNTVTFNDTNINIVAGSAYATPTVSTVNAVDLSSFTTLSTIISDGATSHDRRKYKGILKAVTLDESGKETVAATTALTNGPSGSTFPQTDLDVSALTGEYYIRIVAQYVGGTASIAGTLFVHKVWLE